jgi:hypothetical protein
MTRFTKTSAAVIALMIGAPPAFADTTVQKTVTVTTPAVATSTVTTTNTVSTTTGPRDIGLLEFDMNSDKILSRDEVGRMLFKLCDADGNNIIDNNEYERRLLVTVKPIEKSTTVSYDFDGDGIADKTQTTDEVFMRETLLSRLDTNKDGLSPHEFTGRDFMEADVNHDHAVDLKEWQGSYNASIDASNKLKANVNK